MTVYDVKVTKELTLTATVRIEADSEEEAKALGAEYVSEHLSDDEMDVEGEEITTECSGPSEDQSDEADWP